ncbi:MAG: diaminopimelate epimerase [Bacteroidetes bacterium HGW-Bacteroidetes-21]|jgi:diaminopimelate epimerase|nr:MAG: diaminopimelate epimerase [Bacteroidetes bacterium HGW-Bacteroidetes-21]
MTLHFYKYHGAGNDFIIADARKTDISLFTPTFVQNICDRHFGIGADGLMILLESESADFAMKYFNSDGPEGTMCGNGGRCITAFAKKMGIIGQSCHFMAVDGLHFSEILDDGLISLDMNNVNSLTVLTDGILTDTGSPHFVTQHPDPHLAEVVNEGRKLRYDKRLGETGANVNFVSFNHHEIKISTYERGVEDETLACGTGAVASAISVSKWDGTIYPEYTLFAKGGTLYVSFTKEEDKYTTIKLKGPATFVFEGQFYY